MALIRAFTVVAPLALAAMHAGAQVPQGHPADVQTIQGIIRASYEVISGPAGAPRQWRRDSTLYAPGANFIAMTEREGKPTAITVSAEEYRSLVNDRLVARGLFEREIGSRVERFGNVAVVRSVYELRRTENGPVEQRGVNYFTLYHDGTRWYISHIVWDVESPRNRIPSAWIPRRTRAR